MLNVLTTILGLIPTIIQAILAIEKAIPQGGKGAEKLEAIKETLVIADENITPLLPKVAAVIGVFVKLFNKTGAMPSAAAAPEA